MGKPKRKKTSTISTSVKSNKNFNPETFKTTAEIPVSKRLIDQVISQEDAVQIVKKAAKQRRHVLLIGEPGTGKSMLGLALAELLPREKLVDVLAFPNPNDENQPLIRTVEGGKGRDLVLRSKMQGSGIFKNQNIIIFALAIIAMIIPWWIRQRYQSDIMFAAFFIGGLAFLGIIVLSMNMGRKMMGGKNGVPKLIVDNFDKNHVPFYDATGSHAGALLGDVLHDPFQSGGLGTPANERIVAGMIHKANMGVLFIDEISTLHLGTQQELLTALQEGKYSITGQSERSAGAMVRTEVVPCSFILVAAGNLDTIQHMHPALRSRVRGYGYEVYMKETMIDSTENRKKIMQFIAQEVVRDKKIPHFSRDAVNVILEEARKRANRKGHLSLLFRDLGGLIRAAGDVAVEEGATIVEREHIQKARLFARTLEKQVADKHIELKKEYEVIVTKGKRIGRVNGMAVMSIGGASGFSGIVQPIESEVTIGGEKGTTILATGKLGEIAKEAITNVSAIIKKFFGTDIKGKHDIFVQFLQTYEGVEGDSASIAIATAIVSALKKIPIKQNIAMTGSLSVRGEVLPVGGVSSKVEAAIEAGIEQVLVPKANVKDIILDKDKVNKIKITPVETIQEVLDLAFDWKGKQNIRAQIKRK